MMTVSTSDLRMTRHAWHDYQDFMKKDPKGRITWPCRCDVCESDTKGRLQMLGLWKKFWGEPSNDDSKAVRFQPPSLALNGKGWALEFPRYNHAWIWNEKNETMKIMIKWMITVAPRCGVAYVSFRNQAERSSSRTSHKYMYTSSRSFQGL